MYGWAVGTVICGVLATFSALAVPAFMPIDAMAMVEEATQFGSGAAAIGGGLVAGTAGMEESQAGKAYDQAKALLDGNKAAELADAERAHDMQIVIDFITSGGKPKNNDNAKTWDVPEQLRHEAQTVFGPTYKSSGSAPPQGGGASGGLRKRALEPRTLQKRGPPTAFSYVSSSQFDTHPIVCTFYDCFPFGWPLGPYTPCVL